MTLCGSNGKIEKHINCFVSKRRVEYTKQSIYTTACYCRLSHDDLTDGTSVSIDTQKKLLEDYCQSHGLTIYDFYCDDGYTGTNFNRPDFGRLMRDVNDNVVNTIIVKDLSRLGRNYIEVGKLIEEIFPESGVRFIAIGDNIDTDNSDADYGFMMPLKNVFNQYYPADVSRKTRQAFKAKAKRGEFIGTNAPYGYCKSDADKHVLVVDEISAPIVKEIFEMVAYKGYGYNKVARVLSERRILTPTAYRFQREGKAYSKDPYDWNLVSVRRILENSEYLGCVVNGKKQKLSFKSQKVVPVSEDNWVVVNNTHQPIITRQLWDDAHARLNSRKRGRITGSINIFAGLVKCDRCGYALTLGNSKAGKHYLSCSTYKRKGKDACTLHFIQYDDLYQIVLSDIREKLSLLKSNEEIFARRLQVELGNTSTYKMQSLQKEIAETEKRLQFLDKKFDQMYEDRLTGLLPDNKFREMAEKTKAEQEQLSKKLSDLKLQLAQQQTVDNSISQFLEIVRKYTDIKELDSELLNRLVEKIVVGNKIKSKKGYTQQITIHYRFIGDLESIDLSK